MRLVLDTNVVVAAFRSPTGASAGLISAAVDRRFEMLSTPSLFLEYESVLRRPEHLAPANARQEDVTRFLDMVVEVVVPVDVTYRYRPQLPDPDDEFVLECAFNGGADAIVTFERRTFAAAAERFGVATVTPAVAWGMLKSP